MNKGKKYLSSKGKVTSFLCLFFSVVLVGLGVVSCVFIPEIAVLYGLCFFLGALFLALTVHSFIYVHEEERRNAKRDQARIEGEDDKPIREADFSIKYKLLCGTTVPELDLRICYRSLGTKNELIVNDAVYDEKKGIIEHSHNLSAIVNGHRIDAGFDGMSQSYIKLDGVLIANQLRLI